MKNINDLIITCDDLMISENDIATEGVIGGIKSKFGRNYTKEIENAIKKFKKNNVKITNLIALVTNTSYEVIFYGIYDGKKMQSNEMVENDVLSSTIIDDFYNDIATIVRNASIYDAEKMNILKYANNGNIIISQDERNVKIYNIKKEWQNTI